jgi:hypothetical protein
MHSERGSEAGPSTGGASSAGVEIGEQHAMGAVPGGPRGDRPSRDVGVEHMHTLLTTCESSLLVSFVHMFHRALPTAINC